MQHMLVQVALESMHFGSGDVDNARVGIGTSVAHFPLDLGKDDKVGTGLTNIFVRNESRFIETVTAHSGVNISGILSATNYKVKWISWYHKCWYCHNFNSYCWCKWNCNTSYIWIISSDLEQHHQDQKLILMVDLRVKSLHENVEELDISSGNVNVDLSKGQSFNLNIDAGSYRIHQLSIHHQNQLHLQLRLHKDLPHISVGIDTFTNNATGAGADSLLARW